MQKFDHLRESELRTLVRAKAETILIMNESAHRPGDNHVIAELGAEISAISVAIARQSGEVH